MGDRLNWIKWWFTKKYFDSQVEGIKVALSVYLRAKDGKGPGLGIMFLCHIDADINLLEKYICKNAKRQAIHDSLKKECDLYMENEEKELSKKSTQQ